MSDQTHSSSNYAVATLDADIRVNGKPTRALYIGTAGTIAVVRPDGTTVQWPTIPAGSIIPIQCRQINSSGTTASNIMVMY